MSMELLQEINDNYHMAIAMHRELADSFLFIGLEGYSLWNELQHMSESLEQRNIKNYMSKTYFICAPDKLPTSANIVEPLLSGKNRMTLKMDDVWTTAKELFRIYQQWETSSLQKYERIAGAILANGNVSAFKFVSKIIKGVKDELDYLNNKMVEIEAHGWDMPTIVAEQPDYIERYKYLIDNFHGEPEEYHHYNSSLDAESRKTLLKKSPGK